MWKMICVHLFVGLFFAHIGVMLWKLLSSFSLTIEILSLINKILSYVQLQIFQFSPCIIIIGDLRGLNTRLFSFEASFVASFLYLPSSTLCDLPMAFSILYQSFLIQDRDFIIVTLYRSTWCLNYRFNCKFRVVRLIRLFGSS